MTPGPSLRDVERQLAEEDETAELGVHLSEHGDTVVVQGEVASHASLRAVLDRVRALRPDQEIIDQLTCVEDALDRTPRAAERLR